MQALFIRFLTAILAVSAFAAPAWNAQAAIPTQLSQASLQEPEVGAAAPNSTKAGQGGFGARKDCLTAAGWWNGGDGIAFEDIKPTAVESCQEALRNRADDPALVVALARAQLRIGDENRAFKLLEANKGGNDPVVLALLGSLYETGRGTAEDRTKARELYSRAANQGNPFAEVRLGWLEETAYSKLGGRQRSLELYKRAAASSSGLGLAALGWAYERGIGGRILLQDAVDLYIQASLRGDTWATVRLATLNQNSAVLIHTDLLSPTIREILARFEPLDEDASILRGCEINLPLIKRFWNIQGNKHLSLAKMSLSVKQRNGSLAQGIRELEALPEPEPQDVLDLLAAYASMDLPQKAVDLLIKVNQSKTNWHLDPQFQANLGSLVWKVTCLLSRVEPETRFMATYFDAGSISFAPLLLCAYGFLSKDWKDEDLSKDKDEAEIRRAMAAAGEMSPGALNLIAHNAPLNMNSINMFERAALSGDGQAITNVGVGQEYKWKGVQGGSFEATRWYFAAAELRHPKALRKMGDFYAGDGIAELSKVDLPRATEYYRRASEMGDRPSTKKLATLKKADAEYLNILAKGQDETTDALHRGLVGLDPAVVQRFLAQAIHLSGAGTQPAVAARTLEAALRLAPTRPQYENISMHLNLARKRFVHEQLLGLPDYFVELSESCVDGAMSKSLYDAGSPDLALFFAKLSVNRLQDARRELDELPKDLRECFLKEHEDRYRWLAKMFIEQGRYSEAEQVLLMLQDSEYADFVRGTGNSRAMALRKMPLTLQEKEVAGLLSEGVVSLTDASKRQSALERTVDSLTPSEQGELRGLQEQTKSWNIAFDQRVQQLNADWRRPCDRTSGFDCAVESRLLSNEGFDDVQEVLKSSNAAGSPAAALFSFVTDNETTLLLVTESVRVPLVWKIGSRDLAAKVAQLRQKIATGGDDKPLGQEFYHQIIWPFRSELNGIKTIVLSMDRALSGLPLGALYDGNNYLAQDFTLAVYVGGSGHVTRAPPRVAAFGVASETKLHLPPLPAVKKELESIVRESPNENGIFPGRRYLGLDFNREEMLRAVSTQYSILHFATHFTIDGANFDDAKLLIGEKDGDLVSVRELQEILAPVRKVGPELLVLSACSTGMPIEGLDGTPWRSAARMLKESAHAGAVIGTLWSVGDGSTAVFMQRFYSILAKDSNLSFSEALSEVQRDFIAASQRGETVNSLENDPDSFKQSWAKPAHWAGFLIVGGWN